MWVADATCVRCDPEEGGRDADHAGTEEGMSQPALPAPSDVTASPSVTPPHHPL